MKTKMAVVKYVDSMAITKVLPANRGFIIETHTLREKKRMQVEMVFNRPDGESVQTVLVYDKVSVEEGQNFIRSVIAGRAMPSGFLEQFWDALDKYPTLIFVLVLISWLYISFTYNLIIYTFYRGIGWTYLDVLKTFVFNTLVSLLLVSLYRCHLQAAIPLPVLAEEEVDALEGRGSGRGMCMLSADIHAHLLIFDIRTEFLFTTRIIDLPHVLCCLPPTPVLSVCVCMSMCICLSVCAPFLCLKMEKTVTKKGSGKMRYCRKCLGHKSDRMHHCSECDRCFCSLQLILALQACSTSTL